MEGPFTFENLSTQESREKKERSLTKIESSFFRYVANYLDQLETAYRKEQERNASSKRAAFLSDELRNATNKADELWKAREKKIVAFAQLNARKDASTAPPENLTRDEASLYEALVRLLREQWQRMLPQRLGDASPHSHVGTAMAKPTPPTAPPATVAATASPAKAPQASPAASPPPAPAATAEVQTIRALEDIPPFVGFDGKTYRIKKGEVVSLPKKFAAILKERNQVALVG